MERRSNGFGVKLDSDDPEDDTRDDHYRGRPPGTSPPETVDTAEVNSIDDVHALARKHTKEAVETLAELMGCRGRQAMVAAVASTALLKLADVDEERIKQLVEERVAQLIAEAEERKQLAAPPGAR